MINKHYVIVKIKAFKIVPKRRKKTIKDKTTTIKQTNKQNKNLSKI